MTTLGKAVRLERIFSHPSGRILAVAVDHMINYPSGMPAPLRVMAHTLEQIVAGAPSSITMNKGVALRLMPPYAGRVPLIVQSMALRPGEPQFAATATPAEAAAMGADAIAVAMFVKCREEMAYLEHLAAVVRDAAPLGLPVIPHIYPLSSGSEQHAVTHDPEDVYYAVRVGFELGADIVKAPYTGDAASFRDIVNATPVPVVAAGGPRCATLEDAAVMLRDVARAGAAGATIGRNVWGFPDIPQAIAALKAALWEEA